MDLHAGPSVNEVPQLLLAFLREMNAEATSIRPYKGSSYPTRLREYSHHDSQGDFKWERGWTVRLAELFRQRGVTTSTFSRYDSGEIGDLDLSFPDFTMKGAWRYNLHPVPSSNKSYSKHLTSPIEGAANDFLKLRQAPSTHVGMLVIGFDTPLHNLIIDDSEIIEMKKNGQFADFQWLSFYDEWDDNVLPGSRARIWYWQREQSN